MLHHVVTDAPSRMHHEEMAHVSMLSTDVRVIAISSRTTANLQSSLQAVRALLDFKQELERAVVPYDSTNRRHEEQLEQVRVARGCVGRRSNHCVRC